MWIFGSQGEGMLVDNQAPGHSCRAAWVGVNEKNLENQKRRLRFPTRIAASGLLF